MEHGGVEECDSAMKTLSSEHRNYRFRPLEGEGVLLTGINFCAHLRSQLNAPIPVDNDSLPQLLSKPITDVSVELDKCTQKLSDAFQDLLEDHLHIIMRLPGKQIYT